MSTEPTRYARREFLGHCAAVPLAINAVANTPIDACAAEDVPLLLLNRPKMPEPDLAKKVESLLKLVDPQVIYRYTPLPDEQNAWPFWKQAGDAFTNEPEDDEFQEGVDQLVETGVVPPPHVCASEFAIGYVKTMRAESSLMRASNVADWSCREQRNRFDWPWRWTKLRCFVIWLALNALPPVHRCTVNKLTRQLSRLRQSCGWGRFSFAANV